MAVSTGDIIRVAARQSYWHSDDVINVYHYQRLDIAGDITDLQAMTDISTVLETVHGPLATYQTDNFYYEDLTFYNLNDDTSMGTLSWPTLTAGGVTQTLSLPQQSAALVSLRTGVPNVVGRKYFGGFSENDNASGGGLSAALIAALATGAANLIGQFVGTYGTWQAGTLNAPAGLVRPFIQAVVNEIFRTQRRRTYGVGS